MNRAFIGVLVIALSTSCVSCALTGSAGLRKDIACEYYALAEGYAGLSKYDRAEQYYLLASKQEEYRNASMYGVARMKALSGKWAESAALLKVLYEQDAANTLLASAYAYALVNTSETEAAKQIYQRLYESNMDDPGTCKNFAQVLVLAGDYKDALVLISELEKKFAGNEIVLQLQKIREAAEKALLPPVVTEATTATAAVPESVDTTVKKP